VGHHIGEQLVEAVVDPLLVKRLPECAGSIEQELRDPRLPLQIPGVDPGKVTN